jgi:hypothetical protein
MNTDKLRKDLILMFWQPGIDYAVMTNPDISKTEEELAEQQELWLKLNNAYQQGVKDVVEFIFDNYNLESLPVKEKLKNLETYDELKKKIEIVYKIINESLEKLVNDNQTRLWVAVKLKENLGSQVAVQCDRHNNPKEIIDQNLLIAKVTWNSDYSKTIQLRQVEMIFGEKIAVEKYQNQHFMDNETYKFIAKGI